MKKILLIYRFEWKNLKASKVMMIACSLLIASGLYSIYYGSTEIKKQVTHIQSLRTQEQIRMDTIRQRLKADTTVQAHKEAYLRTTNPAQLNRFVKIYATNTPTPMASLSLGQRDLHPYYIRLDATAFYKQINTNEIKNPLKLFTGNFDLAFVFIYLFPLVIILLTYNIYSAEKEQGTLPLLASQPLKVSQVMWVKTSFRLCLVILLGVFITFSGVLINRIPIVENMYNISKWLGVVSLYALFWFALMYGLISLRKNSALNAFAGLGIWLLLTLIFPALLNITVNIQAPPPAKGEMVNMIRTRSTNQWGNPKSYIFDKFYPKYPQYNDGDTLNFYKWMYAGYLLMDKDAQKIDQKFQQQIQKRKRLSQQWLWLTPAVLVQKQLNQIAQTDSYSQVKYLQKARKFHRKLIRFYYPKIFKEHKVTLQDLKKLPFYQSNQQL